MSFVGGLVAKVSRFSPGYMIHHHKKLPSGILGLWGAAVRQAALDLQKALRNEKDFWTQAIGVDAACYLLHMAETLSLPPRVVQDARDLLARVNGNGEEYLAAAAYGLPAWKEEWRMPCLRCGRPTRWMQVFTPPEAHQGKPWAWRYERPENHIPLCNKCRWKMEERFGSLVYRDLALALWGPRFRAWEHVHRRALEGPDFRPDWDVERFPLWPYGGKDWAYGSGAAEHARPRPPRGVARGAEERRLAEKYRARGLPGSPLARIAAGREPYPVRKRRCLEGRNGR